MTEQEREVADKGRCYCMKNDLERLNKTVENADLIKILIERGRFFKDIIDNIPSLILVKDAETLKFCCVNRAAEKMLGYSLTELEGKTVHEIFPQAEAELLSKQDIEVLTTAKSMEFREEKITTKRFGQKIIRSKKIPLLDEDGLVRHILVTAEDLTEQKMVEAALLKTQNELQRRNKELWELSLLDGLTKIANRRNLDAVFDKEWRRAQRMGLSLAFIMLDIDQFKNYNDAYGHQAGDECLKKIAQELKAVGKRDTDLAARFGGEEFALVLPDTGIEAAAELAEELRVNIEALKIRHEKSSVSNVVTASLGVAAIVPSRKLKSAEFIAAVDLALYQAKREGRNRIKIAEDLTLVPLSAEDKKRNIAIERKIIFGINPFLSPRFIWENYVPILKEVAQEIGFEAQINIVSDYDALGLALLSGTIDIGWFSPLAYVMTKIKGEIIPLVTPVVNRESSYEGYIIARKDLGVNSLDDLQGLRFGFVDPQSASGYLYPASRLSEQGLTPERFFSEMVFLGNHQRVINAVLEGVVDAGATYSEAIDNAALRGVRLDEIIIVEKSKPIPKDAIAARGNLGEDIIKKVKQSFINVSENDARYAEFMKNTAINGFVEANDAEYEGLRTILKANE